MLFAFSSVLVIAVTRNCAAARWWPGLALLYSLSGWACWSTLSSVTSYLSSPLVTVNLSPTCPWAWAWAWGDDGDGEVLPGLCVDSGLLVTVDPQPAASAASMMIVIVLLMLAPNAIPPGAQHHCVHQVIS